MTFNLDEFIAERGGKRRESARFDWGSKTLTYGNEEDKTAPLETGAQDKFVTHPRLLAGLAALAATVHLAAFDSRLGQGAGLVEACCPEPLVQADLVVFFLLVCHRTAPIISGHGTVLP